MRVWPYILLITYQSIRGNMQYRLFTSKLFVICSALTLSMAAYAEKKEVTKVAQLKVSLPAIAHGKPIPGEYAFCVVDGAGKGKFGPNHSPEIKWEGAPKGTKSFALIVVDPKVPSMPDNINKEGKTVSKDLPRYDNRFPKAESTGGS